MNIKAPRFAGTFTIQPNPVGRDIKLTGQHFDASTVGQIIDDLRGSDRLFYSGDPIKDSTTNVTNVHLDSTISAGLLADKLISNGYSFDYKA